MKRIVAYALAVLALVTVAPVLVAGPSQGTTRFTSCDQMHRSYKYGVARDAAAQARAVREGMYKPALKPQVYNASYKTLDRDKDGVMCEVPR